MSKKEKIKKQPQELTLELIKSEEEQYEKLKKINLSKDVYTYINVKFHPKKIDEMLKEFSDTLSDLEKAGYVIEQDEIINFLMLHIIKTFSSLGNYIPNSSIEKYKAFDFILYNPHVEKLVKSFDKKEIAKVFDRLTAKLNDFMEFVKLNKQARQKLMKELDSMKLENKDLIMNLLLQDNSVVQ